MTQSLSRILIIDDEADVAHLLSVRLKSRGYLTQCHHEGKTALEKILNDKPDLVILDLNLPDVSGVEIYQNLRLHPDGKKLPVLFFSADVLYVDYCLYSLKAQGFIRKPYDSEDMLSLVEETLHKSDQNTAA